MGTQYVLTCANFSTWAVPGWTFGGTVNCVKPTLMSVPIITTFTSSSRCLLYLQSTMDYSKIPQPVFTFGVVEAKCMCTVLQLQRGALLQASHKDPHHCARGQNNAFHINIWGRVACKQCVLANQHSPGNRFPFRRTTCRSRSLIT
jgi:hypothetical protein